MPLYEYKCQSCGKTFEVIQKFSDEPLKTHAECGGEVERLISASAFHLKGAGWYATDYAKSNGKSAKSEEAKSEQAKSERNRNDTKSETKSESKTESSTEKKTESKPAASTETKSPAA